MKATTAAAAEPLTTDTLELHAGRVATPTYDRSSLTPAVVHLGVGGFHRAHQGLYLHELAQRGITRGWGIVGVGFRLGDLGSNPAFAARLELALRILDDVGPAAAVDAFLASKLSLAA